MLRAYVGMGSNLGDRIGNLGAALSALDATPGVAIAAVSSTYESEPWGVEDQPAFANLVVGLDVDIDAHQLLEACQRIESDLGRVAGVRYGPRAIDLDILLFGNAQIGTTALTVPHPRLLERDFVVTPLLEIAPGVLLPDGTPVTVDSAIEGRVTRRLAPAPD